MGGAVSHGVMAWRGAHERRALLKTAQPGSSMADLRLAHVRPVSPTLLRL